MDMNDLNVPIKHENLEEVKGLLREATNQTEQTEVLIQNRKKSMQLMNELELISAPLFKFLEDNYNPYTRIVIDFDSVKVVEDVMSIPKTI